jgi:hypothetical protein
VQSLSQRASWLNGRTCAGTNRRDENFAEPVAT